MQSLEDISKVCPPLSIQPWAVQNGSRWPHVASQQLKCGSSKPKSAVQMSIHTVAKFANGCLFTQTYQKTLLRVSLRTTGSFQATVERGGVTALIMGSVSFTV